MLKKIIIPVLLCLLLIHTAGAEESTAKKTINGEVLIKNISWRDALSKLAGQTKTIICFEEIMERSKEVAATDVSVKMKNPMFGMVLDELAKLSSNTFSWEENDGVIVIMPKGTKMMKSNVLNARVPPLSLKQRTIKEIVQEDLPKALGKEWNAEFINDKTIPSAEKYDLEVKYLTVRKVLCKLSDMGKVSWRYNCSETGGKGNIEFLEQARPAEEPKIVDLTNPDRLELLLLRTNATDVVEPAIFLSPDIRQIKVFEEAKGHYMEITFGPELAQKIKEFASKNSDRDAQVKYNFRNVGTASLSKKSDKLLIRGSEKTVLDKMEKKMLKNLEKK